MKIKYIFGFIYLIVFIVTISGEDDENNEVFVATKEWKVVNKGQKIPKGLHVRVNFETGITEAKLLDESEEPKSNALTAPRDPLAGIDIKSRTKFKSYDEIKKDLDDLNLTPKTDTEILKKLMKKFQTDGPSTSVFEDLEFLAHQYDNALNFVDLKGFKEIIYKSLNTTNNEFKKESLILLGSLAQNNPTVQIHAIETGSLNILLRMLAENSKECKSETVFALGSILRRFPWAQLKFLETGGLGTLINLLDNAEIKTGIKVVTLLDDLISEHKSAKEHKDVNPEKSDQYNNVDIETKLVEAGYCQKIEGFFIKLVLVDENDFDRIERCLMAMRELIHQCNFRNLRKTFQSLRKKLQEESSISLIDEMLQAMPKDEL